MEEEIKLPKSTILKLIKKKIPVKNMINSNLVSAFNDILICFINKISNETNNNLINSKKSKLTNKEIINQLYMRGFKGKLGKLNEELVNFSIKNKEKLNKKKQNIIKDESLLKEKMIQQNKILEELANKINYTTKLSNINIYEEKENNLNNKIIEDFEDF